MSPAQRPFRFGVTAPQARSGAEYIELARRAEQLGYSTLLLPDTPGLTLAPFSALGVVAGATTRLRVGNWVLANDFRHPILVAREAATLALLSGDRFELGLGPGRNDNDYASLGLADLKQSGGVRLKKLGEALEIMRGLFAGESVTFDGEYYHVRGAKLYPLPGTRPPLLIAAARPRAVAQAGRYADIVALGTRSRDFLAQQVEWLKEAAGDRFQALELACYTFVVPENQSATVSEVSAVVQRSFGFDLQQAIAEKAPNVLQGSVSAMVEQLEERRATFGLTYVVIGAYDALAFAPVVQRMTGGGGANER
jgi:probable F420-dependent oxidoreductase